MGFFFFLQRFEKLLQFSQIVHFFSKTAAPISKFLKIESDIKGSIEQSECGVEWTNFF